MKRRVIVAAAVEHQGFQAPDRRDLVLFLQLSRIVMRRLWRLFFLSVEE
jgi:hypothetical protein